MHSALKGYNKWTKNHPIFFSKTKIKKSLGTKLWNVHSALKGYNKWTNNHPNLFSKTKIQKIGTKLRNVHSS